MKVHLKPVAEQTIVITGATSGIGLTTARMAAAKGARVVLVARNEQALQRLSGDINARGGQSIYSAADVADETALGHAARAAAERFGGFDSWVNNAGTSIYGRITDVPLADFRRLFETNFWGVVNGSRIAFEHLRRRGGAVINLGSEVSDAPVPLQGMYSASKHAVKGFTDALRMEARADRLPISVTLIKPTAIHTPFPQNARNYLPYEPQLPPPLYAPELVAEAILYCAEHPRRDFFVGGMATSMALNAPAVYGAFNAALIDSMQNSGVPTRPGRRDGLYRTNSRLRQRGPGDRFVREHSLYQSAGLHPAGFAAAVLLAGSALASLLQRMARTDRMTRRGLFGRRSLLQSEGR